MEEIDRFFSYTESDNKPSYLPFCKEEVPETRKRALRLPKLSEAMVSRHYEALSKKVYGVCDGVYPLGSCTMKYNPKLNERVAAHPLFTQIHPLQPKESVQGCYEVMDLLTTKLKDVTGMDEFTLQPAAGAHGELTGMLMIRAYHQHRNDLKRTKILIIDSAHGTNPASAAMAGFTVVSVPSDENGYVDLVALKALLSDEVAGLMLTNPNTLGLFDPNVLEITNLVHACGGLCYYDGANLNAILSIARPGDMGFDVMHVNLHKTFSTPHGGGGPGSGPTGCKHFLAPYLPGLLITKEKGQFVPSRAAHSIGNMKAFYGNFTVLIKALAYLMMLGDSGLFMSAALAVLNANYLKNLLKDHYQIAYSHTCMHEFVMSPKNARAIDIAKGVIDAHMHPPTIYFPLIVPEALMLEPTETETKQNLEEMALLYIELAQKSEAELKDCPKSTPVQRLDEVEAARHPKLRYEWKDGDS